MNSITGFRAGSNIRTLPPVVKPPEREFSLHSEIKEGREGKRVAWYVFDLATGGLVASDHLDLRDESESLSWLRGIDAALKWVRSRFRSFALQVAEPGQIAVMGRERPC